MIEIGKNVEGSNILIFFFYNIKMNISDLGISFMINAKFFVLH